MEIFDALKKRKMTRAFTAQRVETATVEQLLYAATRGPSAGNTASLEVLVLTGPRCEQYWDITLGEQRRSAFGWPGLLRAPVLMIPTVAPGDYLDRYSEPDKSRRGLGSDVETWAVPYWWVDGGAGVENILLAATAVGLGACFFGQFDYELAVSEHFGIPDGRRSLGTIALGYPDVVQDRPSRSSLRRSATVAQRSHWEQW